MKRFAAIVLCDLACELARARGVKAGQPLAVIIDDLPCTEGERDTMACVLDAVDEIAWRYGARPGQTAAEAVAYVAKLHVAHLARAEVEQALAAVAEVALAFAPTVAVELDRPQPQPFLRYPAGMGAGPLDTVWLDITGCERLLSVSDAAPPLSLRTGSDGAALGNADGQAIFCHDLRARIAALGHRSRVAIADGPRLAQALARWGAAESFLPFGKSAEALAELPVAALPLDADTAAWFGKLGIWTIADLMRIDRSRLAHRLSARGSIATDLLALCEGRDDVPLSPYRPPRRIVEEACFEEPLSSQEPLMFVLRRLSNRAAARISSRGEACAKASLELGHDRAALTLAERAGRALPDKRVIDLSLPVPIAREEELIRTIHSKVERLEVRAPISTVALVLEDLTRRSEIQLDMMNGAKVSPDALPTLLAELCAAVGPTRVGMLKITDSHRPEARSQLVPASLAALRARAAAKSTPATTSGTPRSPQQMSREPTRLLPEPIAIGKLAPGALIGADRHMYLVDHLRLYARLEGIEWWSHHPISRDYARVSLHAGLSSGRTEHAEAWVYVDSATRQAFIHGWFG